MRAKPGQQSSLLHCICRERKKIQLRTSIETRGRSILQTISGADIISLDMILSSAFPGATKIRPCSGSTRSVGRHPQMI